MDDDPSLVPAHPKGQGSHGVRMVNVDNVIFRAVPLEVTYHRSRDHGAGHLGPRRDTYNLPPAVEADDALAVLLGDGVAGDHVAVFVLHGVSPFISVSLGSLSDVIINYKVSLVNR